MAHIPERYLRTPEEIQAEIDAAPHPIIRLYRELEASTQSKITLGKSLVNGFFSVQDGDIYTLPDKTNAVVKAGAGIFWTLYHTREGKADYTRPPVPEWENIEGQSGMVHMINREYYNAN